MPKELKKIGFTEAGSVRADTVEVEGYEPFDITFKLPGQAARLAIMFVIEQSKDGAVGNAVIDFLAEHVISWTLPEKFCKSALDRLDNSAAIFAMFSKIKDASDARKN